MSEGKLAGRPAIITGAATGIGRAIAEHLAAEGAPVLCADIALDGAERVAASIHGSGGRAEAVECDVAQSGQVRAAVERAVAAFGGLHTVVANAATYTPRTTVDQLDEADWERTLAVNLTGAFHLCKHALPHLRTAGRGSIILVASQMGRVASPGIAAYCATKGALLQLAKGLALDHAAEGIRANTLSPGGIATDRQLQRFADMDTAQREWGARHPLGRLGEPAEMARGAVFLASDDSSFMTGADLLLDGGYAAW